MMKMMMVMIMVVIHGDDYGDGDSNVEKTITRLFNLG